MNSTPIRKTVSLCPVCRRRLPADVVEADGSVYMEKDCPEHGHFRSRIGKYPRYYRELMELYRLLAEHFPYRRDRIESCAFTTTLRCNMSCPICFAADEGRVMPPEMPLAEIREKLKPLRGRGINFKLTGGESTVRDDLGEIVAMIRASGNFPVMVTNARRLDDLEYLQSLADRGLYAVAPWFDTTDSDGIYETMRGEPLLGQREKVLENVRRAGLKLIIFFVCARGVNDDQLPGILALTRSRPELFKINVMGYMHRGSRGFGRENEYLADELWDAVVASSAVFSSPDELFTALKINLISRAVRRIYHCFNSQTVLMPRSDRREDGFDLEKWDGIVRRFREMLPGDPGRARRFFLRRFAGDLFRMGFSRPLARRFIPGRKELADTFIPPGYYWLQFQCMYYPENYDEEMVREFCPYPSFNPGLEKRVSFCEYYNLGLKT
ncbi:MAG TPA: radical SAM protein [bacterium]|nr:radical SAM protein [bacterium]HPQ66970.1 radical SAM protein [bacterium]